MPWCNVKLVAFFLNLNMLIMSAISKEILHTLTPTILIGGTILMLVGVKVKTFKDSYLVFNKYN